MSSLFKKEISFIFLCAGSLLENFLWFQRAGAAPQLWAGAQAQQVWLPGLAAPQLMGSSQSRNPPRTGRRILSHWATREVPILMCLICQHFPSEILALQTYSSVSQRQDLCLFTPWSPHSMWVLLSHSRCVKANCQRNSSTSQTHHGGNAASGDFSPKPFPPPPALST